VFFNILHIIWHLRVYHPITEEQVFFMMSNDRLEKFGRDD